MKHSSRIESSRVQDPLHLHSIAANETTKVQKSKEPLTDCQGACVSKCSQSTCFSERNKQDKNSKDPLVLVIYSPNSPEKDKHVVMQNLVCDLGNHCIQTECYDTSYSSLRKNVSAWLEDNFKKASVILCVCDAQFKKEWSQQSFFPLIFSLQQLVYAMLSRSTPLSRKFAVVLLRESDRQHIPEYLNSTRYFLVDQVKEIVLFVHEIPKCVKPEH